MTASKVRVAMAAATHHAQALPTIELMPLIFSSSVAATAHKAQVFSAADFEFMIAPFNYIGAKSRHATDRYTLASILVLLYQ